MIARSLWKFKACLCPHAASMCIRHKRTPNHDPEMYYNELKSINDSLIISDRLVFGTLCDALAIHECRICIFSVRNYIYVWWSKFAIIRIWQLITLWY